MNNNRLILKGNVDQVASKLLQLITKYGDSATVADVILKEGLNAQSRES